MKTKDLKSSRRSSLTTCVLLVQLFQSASLCSAFSQRSLYILLACCSKRSLWPCPASLCVSVFVHVSVCRFSDQFSLLRKLWIAHLLQNTGPDFYFTYPSGHLLQVSSWWSYEPASRDRCSQETASILFFLIFQKDSEICLPFYAQIIRYLGGTLPEISIVPTPGPNLALSSILNSGTCLCVFLTSWPLFL